MYMRRVDGRKVTRLTPGDLAFCPEGLVKPQGGTMGRQKSAGAIRDGEPSKGSTKQGESVRYFRLVKKEQADG